MLTRSWCSLGGPYFSNALDSLACQSTTNKIISLSSSDENDPLIKVKYKQRRGCNGVAQVRRNKAAIFLNQKSNGVS